MRFAYFTHSLASCWNHGNAHFLRGVLRELVARGHSVRALEPAGAWSRRNLQADGEPAAERIWEAYYPELSATVYPADADLAECVGDADVVLVHEWNVPALVSALGRLRRAGRFRLLFHDTHHRAVSDPDAMRRYDLSEYDGVLAFGAALTEVYRAWGWGARAFTWHEAADTRLFHPPVAETSRSGAVWVGNWGDGERTAELEAFLFAPMQAVGLPLDVYGVRYPAEALAMLARHGAQYRGWLPNPRAPEVFARHLMTVHVPRRFYATVLPGIPTIRVFEALACGLPLVTAPWSDAENLFTPGQDYLVARDGEEMLNHLKALCDDPALRSQLASHGLATIQARHTCAHRADELLGILARLDAPLAVSAP